MTQNLRSLHRDTQQALRRPVSRPGRMRKRPTSRRILQAGNHLFRAGEFHNEAFVIRSGHLKSYLLHQNGEEQILGVHGPGDTLGFDAMLGTPASCSVIALEIASIEAINLDHSGLSPMLNSAGIAGLVEGMYRELQRLAHLLYIDRHPAERRLAEFLLHFSRDEAQRGKSPLDLMLPVNRRDLARFLGLAPETLSRTFGRFQDQGILSVDNREIHIIDHEALIAAAGE